MLKRFKLALSVQADFSKERTIERNDIDVKYVNFILTNGELSLVKQDRNYLKQSD